MTSDTFKVTAWNNGKGDNGSYGFRVPNPDDRIRYFCKSVDTAILYLPGNKDPVVANISKDSFWEDKKCGELIDVGIREWFRKNSYEKGGKIWTKGLPPNFWLQKISNSINEYKLLGRCNC